jgi:LPXTG-motif cell wall-anchored protein
VRSTLAFRWYNAIVIACITLNTLLCSGWAIASAAPAAVVRAAVYPPAPPSVTASASSVCAGCTVTVSWTGFKPGSTISITMHSERVYLGTATVDATGTASKILKMPHDIDRGVHTITGAGTTIDGNGMTLSIKITVTKSDDDDRHPRASATPDADKRRVGQSSLAHTGAAALIPAGIGAALLGGGASLISMRRRRSAPNATEL